MKAVTAVCVSLASCLFAASCGSPPTDSTNTDLRVSFGPPPTDSAPKHAVGRGFIDKTGKMVISPRWKSPPDAFSEGFSRVGTDRQITGGDKAGNAYELIDKTGKVVMQPTFISFQSFSQGLAPVEVSRKWGFMDKTGKVVIKPQFDEVVYFREGLCPVQIGQKRGVIDKSGRLVVEPKFAWIGCFSEGMAPYSSKEISGGGTDKFGMIDTAGNIIMQPWLSESTWFDEGLAMTRVDGHARFIDKTGGTVLDLKDFCNAWGFAEGLAPVEVCADRGIPIYN